MESVSGQGVTEDIDNATSLSKFGPSSVNTDELYKKLHFFCQGTQCFCTDIVTYPINHLMPTIVGNHERDLCFTAFPFEDLHPNA